MQGGSGFWLLGICGGGAALLLALLYLMHGQTLTAGGILAGVVVAGVAWRWFGRRFRNYI